MPKAINPEDKLVNGVMVRFTDAEIKDLKTQAFLADKKPAEFMRALYLKSCAKANKPYTTQPTGSHSTA